MDDETFDKFASKTTLSSILSLRRIDGNTFTESDREAIKDGLDIVRISMVQPVGFGAASRAPGAKSWKEFQRALMMICMGAMQLWSSGKLDEIEVDNE